MRKQYLTPIVLALALGYFIVTLAVPLLRGGTPIELGLDLAGGLVVHYRPDLQSRLDSYNALSEQELLGLAKEIIQSRLQRRLNIVPEVVVRSDQRIVVSIPGCQDYERVLDTVGRTYHLTLRLVLDRNDHPLPGRQLYPYHEQYLELAPAQLSGHMLDQSSIRVVTGSPGSLDLDSLAARVAFRFAPPHDRVFAELTGANIGRQLAILIDDQVEWAGVIESAIDGVGQLAGGYSLEQASEVATMLRSGSLPVSLQVESVSAVGPSLGQELQELGWQALLLSLAGLAGLLVLAYLHRGWLVVAGLLSLGALLVTLAGLAATFGFTLDLAGIAGLILSVGIGMDAFLIVFETLDRRVDGLSPDEIRGRRDRLVNRLYAFAGEGRTLLHANATTMLVVLLLLTSERLRSFALFLLAGIVASLLTILVTKQLLRYSCGRLPGIGVDTLGWLRHCRAGVYRLRWVYGVVMLLGVLITAGMLLGGGTAGPGLELGADFTPGSQLALSGQAPGQIDAAVERLREALPEHHIRHQQLGGPDELRSLLTMSGGPEGSALSVERISAILAEEQVSIDSLHAIDERVSGSRLLRSLSVLLLSFCCLALYFLAQNLVERLVFSRSGNSGDTGARLLVFSGVLLAVIADLLVVVMVMVWLGIAVSLPVVAAMLTIIGYSVNDSVVLWSHVQQRWSSRSRDQDTATPLQVVTESVDRVLSRACLTSLSTMLPAVAILVLGLQPLADFAWVVITGTVAGTCSSLFIVGAFVVRALERRVTARTACTQPVPSGNRESLALLGHGTS